ncbi:MAG TPA: PDZ domain-containing protein [Chthoniobacteraceae bacterium]|nr:PDZ domain-containing protein [Chthoniobacteraceae bacterium]
MNPRPSGEETPADLIATLATPDAGAIQKENRRISERLTRHPFDPAAYEEAALLTGLFGLRENSGMFWETRGICNRTTALLAFARALRAGGPVSDEGRLGELLVGLLADTKQESEEAILELQKRSVEKPALSPWVTAASLRNSRDWRVLAAPQKASLLEQTEYIRAVGEAVSPEAALTKIESLPGQARILMQFDFSVESGHRLTKEALPQELAEMVQIFPELTGQKASPERFATVLNQAPARLVGLNGEGKPEIRVIDDGTWAFFFQRHLFHVIQRINVFLSDKWGVPEAAGKFQEAMTGFFSQLGFFPLLEGTGGWPRPDAAARKAAGEWIARHPGAISDSLWAKHAPRGAAKSGGDIPRQEDWFSNGLPPGTAYSFYSRLGTVPRVQQLRLPEMEALYAIAPWHYGVARRYLELKAGEAPTPEQFREVMGRFLDFNLSAMLGYSRLVEDDPQAYAAILKKAAELEPYYHLRLAGYYEKRKMDAEAAAAYEAAIRTGADAVAVANRSKWLINYYYDHGRTDEALAVAKMAAEVYSHRGLEAMAELSEKMGNLAVAEEHFEKIRERYEDSAPLFLFYQRQSAKDPGSPYAPKMKTILGNTFPDGIREASLSDFSGAPRHGVLIAEENHLIRRNGLREGDIITALDGKNVESFPQYAFVRALKEEPAMELIVYRDGKYRTVNASAPGRRFNCDFQTYSAKR